MKVWIPAVHLTQLHGRRRIVSSKMGGGRENTLCHRYANPIFRSRDPAFVTCGLCNIYLKRLVQRT